MKQFRWDYIFGSIVVVGFIERAIVYMNFPRIGDQFGYMYSGAAGIVSGIGFVSPWTMQPLQGYPPLTSILFTPIVLAGLPIAYAKIFGVVLSSSAIIVAWFCTKDIFGLLPAWIISATLAISKLLLDQDALYQPEGFVHSLYIITVWALIKSIQNERYVILAGFTSGLLFLQKSSLGPFVVLAAMGGLLWRLRYHGIKSTVTNKAYLIAGLTFLSLALPWVIRNLIVFDTWETQPYASHAVRTMLLSGNAPSILLKTTWTFTEEILIAIFPFALSLCLMKRAQNNLGNEVRSLLQFSAGIVLLSAITIGSGFVFMENTTATNTSVSRYIIPSLTPFMWLLFERFGIPSNTKDYAIFTICAISSVLIIANPMWIFEPQEDKFANARDFKAVHAEPPQLVRRGIEAELNMVPRWEPAEALISFNSSCNPCITEYGVDK